MLPNDILIKIFINMNNPFKLQYVSKQFRTLIINNKIHISYNLLKRLGFNTIISDSYRIYKNFVSRNDINNINYNLIDAVETGRDEVVELLLTNSKADPTANKNMFIISASLCGYIKIIKLLPRR